MDHSLEKLSACGGEGGCPNWTARIFAILWNQPQRCVYGVYFVAYIYYCNYVLMHVGTHEEASENDLTKIGKVTAAFQDGSSRTSAAECQGQ